MVLRIEGGYDMGLDRTAAWGRGFPLLPTPDANAVGCGRGWEWKWKEVQWPPRSRGAECGRSRTDGGTYHPPAERNWSSLTSGRALHCTLDACFLLFLATPHDKERVKKETGHRKGSGRSPIMKRLIPTGGRSPPSGPLGWVSPARPGDPLNVSCALPTWSLL